MYVFDVKKSQDMTVTLVSQSELGSGMILGAPGSVTIKYLLHYSILVSYKRYIPYICKAGFGSHVFSSLGQSTVRYLRKWDELYSVVRSTLPYLTLLISQPSLMTCTGGFGVRANLHVG